MNHLCRLAFAFALFSFTAFCSEAPLPQPSSQPLMVARAAKSENINTLLDTVTADVFGLTLENRSGPFPGMETGADSYEEFFSGLEENGAQNLWFAFPQQNGMNLSGAGGWRLPDWGGGLEQVEEWVVSLGMDPAKMASRWDGNQYAFGADSDTLAQLTEGGQRGEPWARRLADFLHENPDGAGVYVNPRFLIGALSVLSGEDIRSEMSRLHLQMPHFTSADLYKGDGEYIGFDLRVDGLFPRRPYLTETSASRLVVSDVPDQDRVSIAIAEPMPYLELLGLDRNFLYPFNIDMLAFVPKLANVTLYMDEYRHWNWSMVCLIDNRDKFRRQWRRLTGWLDLLAKTPLSYVDMDMVQTPGGDAVRRIRLGDFEFCIGMGENDRLGNDTVLLTISGRVEDFPGADSVRLERTAAPRLAEWDVKLSEDNRYALADYIAYHMRRYNIDVPGIDRLETAIPAEETGSLYTLDTDVILTSPNGMAAWLAPVLPEVEREVMYRLLP